MGINSSIIITNYNYGKYLGRCIRSCLNQTLPKTEYEIIVVDDKSSDESKEVLKSFGDQIVVKLLKENKGVAYASNQGIKLAKGMFIMRVDADDFINDNMVLFMTKILIENPDIGFVYGDHFKVDKEGTKLKRVNMKNLSNLLNHGAGIMFRKIHLEAMGLYDTNLRNCEDYDLIIRYLRNFDGFHLPMPFYRYTKHDSNMTNNIEARKVAEKKVLDKNQIKGEIK